MEYYNSVKKVDLNGEVYRGIIFDQSIIRKGKMGPLNQNRGYSGFFEEGENEERAVRRAKTCVMDYVRTNVDLNNFVTYTLDSKKIDRYDEKEIYKKMRHWLSNRVKRKGLKYILVPELHKDKAWHFHGFTNVDLKWDYGFQLTRNIKSDADRDNRIKYITDYVKKDMVKFNGRRYLHSNNLEKPVKIYGNIDFESVNSKCIELEDLGVKMKIEKG